MHGLLILSVKDQIREEESIVRRHITVMGPVFVLLLSGCATTVEKTPEAAKALESGASLPPAVTGFFGDDASKLAPGPEGGAALAYVKPERSMEQIHQNPTDACRVLGGCRL